jgi:hypothetical protein
MTNIYTFLADYGPPPRTTPELQTWLAALVEFVAGDLASWVYVEDTAAPTIPTDLDAVWPIGGLQPEGSLVVWKNTTTGDYTLYALTALGTWITLAGLPTAAEVSYTPTTGADWVNPDPTDVEEALDDLAAAMDGLVVMSSYTSGLGGDRSSSSATFADITGASISHTFTKPNASVLAALTIEGITAGGNIEVRIVVASTNGTVLAVNKDSTPQLGQVSDEFDTSSLVGAGAQTVKLQFRNTAGSGSVYARDYVSVSWLVVEWGQ